MIKVAHSWLWTFSLTTHRVWICTASSVRLRTILINCELCSPLLILCEPFIRMKCHTTDGDIGSGCWISIKSPHSPSRALVLSAGWDFRLPALTINASLGSFSPFPACAAPSQAAQIAWGCVPSPVLRKDDAAPAHPLPCQELCPSRVRSSSGAAASSRCDSEAAESQFLSPCPQTSSAAAVIPAQPLQELFLGFYSRICAGGARICSLWDFRDPLNFSGNKDMMKTFFFFFSPLSILKSRASTLLKVPKRKMPSSTSECALSRVRRGRNLNKRHSFYFVERMKGTQKTRNHNRADIYLFSDGFGVFFYSE